jgi:hypothetical protein
MPAGWPRFRFPILGQGPTRARHQGRREASLYVFKAASSDSVSVDRRTGLCQLGEFLPGNGLSRPETGRLFSPSVRPHRQQRPEAPVRTAGMARKSGGACQRPQETVFARDWVVGSSLPTQGGNRRGEYGRRRPRFPDAALALDRSRRRRADLDQITGRPETCRRSAFVQQGRRQAVDKHHLPARRLRRNPIRATAPGRRCR